MIHVLLGYASDPSVDPRVSLPVVTEIMSRLIDAGVIEQAARAQKEPGSFTCPEEKNPDHAREDQCDRERHQRVEHQAQRVRRGLVVQMVHEEPDRLLPVSGDGIVEQPAVQRVLGKPPDDPPGTKFLSIGLCTLPKKLVSFDEPIANSSQFNLPKSIAPSFQIFAVTVDS